MCANAKTSPSPTSPSARASRSEPPRLENADRPNVTMETIERYATALGKDVVIKLVDDAV